MNQLKFINYIKENVLSIEAHFYLIRVYLKENVSLPQKIKEHLISTGLINESLEPTEKAARIIKEAEAMFKPVKGKVSKRKLEKVWEDWEQKLTQYIEEFPPIKLPSGKYARQSPANIKPKMENFINNFPEYDFELIIRATRIYVNEYSKQDYNFMRNSSYFISKEVTKGQPESELANICYLIKGKIPFKLNNTPSTENNHFSVKVV